MKTAVSIPDAVFRAADERARQLGVTRSHLYTRALEDYLDGFDDDQITARLDEVYGAETSSLDEVLAEAQHRAVHDSWR